ncbi:MAG TPA: hypothetical protein VFM73_06550, partial [Xanthomonadaceae bacterium]|nr:hypothetical protein [Xanthomonadaceae bacterium]
PVQRMLSRYHHYVRASGTGEAQLPPGLSLEGFCRLPRFQDTYAKYLWRFPVERFDFIGLTECFDASLADFSRRYGIDCRAPRALNANPAREEPRYDVTPAVERMILAANAADAAIYDQARRRFGWPGTRNP